MIITATELKSNIGKYLQLAEKQDIIITKIRRCQPRWCDITWKKRAITFIGFRV